MTPGYPPGARNSPRSDGQSILLKQPPQPPALSDAEGSRSERSSNGTFPEAGSKDAAGSKLTSAVTPET
jgi:hypothetical protein